MEYTCSGSEENAADYEDDWPTNKVKQKFTFKNITRSPDASSKSIRFDNPEQVVKNGQRVGVENKVAVNAGRTHAPALDSQKKRFVSNTGASRRENIARNSGRNASALLARRKVIRLLIAVIVSFATCVLPYHIRVLWQTWGTPHLSFWTSLLTPMTFLIFYLNSGLNPILYAFLSDNFRRSLREVLTCRRRRRLLRGMSTMSTASIRTGTTTGAAHLTHNP